MLVFSNDQRAQLGKRSGDHFKTRLHAYLKEVVAQFDLPTSDEQLVEICDTALSRSGDYNLETHKQITRYAKILLACGLTYGQDPKSEEYAILNNPNLVGWQKLAKIEYLIQMEERDQ